MYKKIIISLLGAMGILFVLLIFLVIKGLYLLLSLCCFDIKMLYGLIAIALVYPIGLIVYYKLGGLEIIDFFEFAFTNTLDKLNKNDKK